MPPVQSSTPQFYIVNFDKEVRQFWFRRAAAPPSMLQEAVFLPVMRDGSSELSGCAGCGA